MDKGFVKWLKASGADVVGLQETRAQPEQVEEALQKLQKLGWHAVITPAERKGYSGVGLLSRRPPDSLWTTTGVSSALEPSRRFGAETKAMPTPTVG